MNPQIARIGVGSGGDGSNLPRGRSLNGKWYCSPECFEPALTSAVGQLITRREPRPVVAHRIPLGLLMLSRGIVDDEQLKKALKAQKDSGAGRVGEWLRHIGAVSEEQVTQILGVQLSIPVFPLQQSRAYLDCAHLVPLSLLEEAEMVPVHHLPSSQHLFIAFIDRINYSALYAIERMLECHTEPCLAMQSLVLKALQEIRGMPRPAEVMVGYISEAREMATTIVAQAERMDATDIRVNGFDNTIWARLHYLSGYADILFQGQSEQLDMIVAAKGREQHDPAFERGETLR